MRVLITGGHFSPALAVTNLLKKKNYDVAVAGRKYSLEGEAAQSLEYLVSSERDIEFFEVKTGRLQRKFTKYTILSLLKIILGFFEAFKILIKYHPDLILTFGGYLGVPISYVAYFLGIPVVLHEQTTKAGLASKLIGRIAQKICISYEASRTFFPASKVVFTGNPIREEVFEVNKKISILPKHNVIYVTGGSTGSNTINCLIEDSLENLLSKYIVIHQTGDNKTTNDFERLSKKRECLEEDLKKKYILKKFILPSEIGYIYRISDLVISRAGINTVTEILALGKMALFIPLPHGQKHEQLDNARLVKEIGLGAYIEERELNKNLFLARIEEMIKNKGKYIVNAGKAQEYFKKDAAESILRIIEEFE